MPTFVPVQIVVLTLANNLQIFGFCFINWTNIYNRDIFPLLVYFSLSLLTQAKRTANSDCDSVLTRISFHHEKVTFNDSNIMSAYQYQVLVTDKGSFISAEKVFIYKRNSHTHTRVALNLR